MDVFEVAWETAPENKYLKSIYQIDENEDDFYIARSLIDKILFKSYLFIPDTYLELIDLELEILNNKLNDENLPAYLNVNRDNLLHKCHTRLLGFMGKEWVAEVIGNNHPLYNVFLNLSPKVEGLFLYKGQDDTHVFLEHIASGKKFNLLKASFDSADLLVKLDSILFIGIVNWKEEWWFSGVFIQNDFDANIILEEKNSIEGKIAVNFLDHNTSKIVDIIDNQISVFKDYNGGSQIAFMRSDEIDEFIHGYSEYYNNTLNLTAKEHEDAKQRGRNQGFFGTENKIHDFTEKVESGLVFFNSKGGIELAWDINSAFPLPNNPFFDIDKSEEVILHLLMSEDLSAELVMYCIDNCKKDLPFFNSVVWEMYLNDIDFLLHFWKRNAYFTKPAITYTGSA